ncbi:MAG: hypothetical protein QW292_08440, partial [Candidatus Parvarchaeota archaeon]
KNLMVAYEEAKEKANSLIMSSSLVDGFFKSVLQQMDPEARDKLYEAFFRVVEEDPKFKEALIKEIRERGK